MSSKSDTDSAASSSTTWSVVVEVSAGILRLPVARIDPTEVLLDSTIRLQIGQRYELIVERPDGHAELIHAEVSQRSEAGLLLRWNPAHPREISALERLFVDKTPTASDSGDLESALRSRSRLVRTSAIAAQRDSVRVLNLSAIKELIQASVEETIRESGRSLDEKELRRLREESERGFKERLAEFENEKADLQSHIETLTARMNRTQDLLGAEKEREVERDRFTLSEESLGRLEKTLEKIVQRATHGEDLDPAVEQELRAVVNQSLDLERSKAREREETARSENIDLLERKVKRLAKNLDDARNQRDSALETVRRAESRDGFPNPLHTGVSLVSPSEDGSDSERRRALLVDLVSENRQLREKIVHNGSSEKKQSNNKSVEKDLA
ncbi:MAG: hypothetical protein GWP41_02420 [Planctomycetia bacterium]|nr:hypothetical protein [Planctomycetia bacterium]